MICSCRFLPGLGSQGCETKLSFIPSRVRSSTRNGAFHAGSNSLARIQADFRNLPIQVMCGPPQRAKLILELIPEAA
jgi:hypothetical protein